MSDPNKPQGGDKGLETAEIQPDAQGQTESASAVRSDDETAQRQEDAAKAGQIRQELGVDKPENPDLKKTPEQLFESMLRPKMHEVIEALGLGPVIEECRKLLGKLKEGASDKKRASYEKKAVSMLIRPFEKPFLSFLPFMKMKIPAKKWAFFPEAMVGERAANCSGAALVFGTILNEELGIKTEYVSPMGHAANLVTYSDGSTQFVDPRNLRRSNLKLGAPREERDGFRIYKINKRSLEYSLLPVSELKHGVTLTMLENTCALKENPENDQDALATIHDYGYGLDFDFAQKYMEGNFLTVRDREQEWLDERERIQKERKRIDRESYLLTPHIH